MSSDRLDKAWEAADKLGIPVPVGNIVLCDQCSEDFTDSTEQGGFVFGSHAYCPKCAEAALPKIVSFGEEWYIKARALPGESFRDFVLRYTGPDRTIHITKGETGGEQHGNHD